MMLMQISAHLARELAHRLRGVLLLGACLMLVLACGQALAQSPATARDFDHVKTGFPLSGAHTVARCESCHINAVFKGTPKDCASCHTSGFRMARGNTIKPADHIQTQLTCDSCHNTRVFTGAKFNHTGVVPGTCASCHNGSSAPGKPSTHIVTQSSCDSCHTTTAWTPARGFDHSGVLAGTCGSCHNGSRATGKNAAHIPVAGNACDSCHKSTRAWRPTSWNHSQTAVANQCSSCHSGAFPPADGRPVNHIPYQAISGVVAPNCDTCHKGSFAAWAPARFHSNVSVATQCSSCHNGSFPPAVGKPATPVHAGVTNCESCHKTSGWAGAKVSHATFTVATHCASCHNGSSATGKPAMHVPVGATNCVACHSTTTWKPTRFNHTQVTVTAQCSTCHSGAFPPADARPVTHIPYQLLTGVAIVNCDTCHKGSFAAWTPARFHGNVSVSTQCASCHTGLYAPARGKPNTPAHVGVTTCESCHRSTASWLTVVFAHSPANAVGTGTCDTCHNGVSAKGKTPTHIPVPPGLAKCDSCHRSQSSFATATMNHSVVTTATCKSCHNGSYVSQGTIGALAKPVNHIPEAQLLNGAAMDCKACHVGTTSWAGARMNHNGSLGGAAGSCKACHASGTNFLGNMERKALTHQTKTPPAIDCSESGCHRPLGNRGTAYTRWD